MPLRPLLHLQHPRSIVRQFTPNWFGVVMGTGICAQLLATLPGGHGPGALLWLCALAGFVIFSLLYATRWVLYPQEASRVFGHATVSMFFGTVPMALATLLNGYWQFTAGQSPELIYLLWWLDVAMAVGCGVGVPFLMFTRQQHSIEQMSAVWLLPVVACEVAGASGAALVPHLSDPAQQLQVMLTSYVLWALSVPVALAILTILILRMALHKLPHESLAATSWLALGPLGTGALLLLALGANAPEVFATHGLAALGGWADGLGVFGGLMLWGFGAWWLLLAVLITGRYLRRGLPFNLGWWAFVFPLGVFSLATGRLADALGWPVMHLIALGLTLATLAIWAMVISLTVRGAWRGDLFFSPCLAAQIQSRA